MEENFWCEEQGNVEICRNGNPKIATEKLQRLRKKEEDDDDEEQYEEKENVLKIVYDIYTRPSKSRHT